MDKGLITLTLFQFNVVSLSFEVQFRQCTPAPSVLDVNLDAFLAAGAQALFSRLSWDW